MKIIDGATVLVGDTRYEVNIIADDTTRPGPDLTGPALSDWRHGYWRYVTVSVSTSGAVQERPGVVYGAPGHREYPTLARIIDTVVRDMVGAAPDTVIRDARDAAPMIILVGGLDIGYTAVGPLLHDSDLHNRILAAAARVGDRVDMVGLVSPMEYLRGRE